MRKSAVRYGLRMIVAGMVAVIIGTFFHARVADFLRFTPSGEARFVFLSFFGGGLFGGFGILVSGAGLLRTESSAKPVRLAPILFVLALLIALFVILFLVPPQEPQRLRLRPGETITI